MNRRSKRVFMVQAFELLKGTKRYNYTLCPPVIFVWGGAACTYNINSFNRKRVKEFLKKIFFFLELVCKTVVQHTLLSKTLPKMRNK